MGIRVLYRIQAHPSRAARHPELLAQLPLAVTEVVSDEMSPWSGYKRCLSDIPSGVTHVCVLQDDVQLARNFPLAVEKIVEARPENVVSLFVGGLRGPTELAFQRALTSGVRFVEVNPRRIVHVVALVWPRELAESFLGWVEREKIPGPAPPFSDDAVVGWWSLQTNSPVYACVPSLVEHPDEDSVVHPARARSGRDRGRSAVGFIGEDDPLQISWA